jgi:hypothetical protein
MVGLQARRPDGADLVLQTLTQRDGFAMTLLFLDEDAGAEERD